MWEQGSPGNEAVGCCHHPLGPHQETPADMLPVQLDGGDEGPGVGCHHLSPDDPAPLGAWWVGAGGHQLPESPGTALACVCPAAGCVSRAPQLYPQVPGSGRASAPAKEGCAWQGEASPALRCSSPGSPSPAPAVGTSPAALSPVTCRGQCREQDGAPQAEDEQPGRDHAGAEWATATSSGAAQGWGCLNNPGG